MEAQNLCKKQSTVMYAYGPSAGETETGGPGPGLAASLPKVQIRRDIVSNINVDKEEEDS